MENTCVHEHIPLHRMACSQSQAWPTRDVIKKEVFEGIVKARYLFRTISFFLPGQLALIPSLALFRAPRGPPGSHTGDLEVILAVPLPRARLPITPDFTPSSPHCCQSCPSSGPQHHLFPRVFYLELISSLQKGCKNNSAKKSIDPSPRFTDC